MQIPPRHDDDALLRDINHAAHTSGGREGFMAFVVVCCGSLIFFSVYPAAMVPLFLKVLLTLFVAIGTGAFFVWWIGGASRRHANQLREDIREVAEAERARQIAAAKESGAFARWEQKD